METDKITLRGALINGVNTSIELVVSNAEEVFSLPEGELGHEGLSQCMLLANDINVAEGEEIKNMYTDVYPVSVVSFSALLDNVPENQGYSIKLNDVQYINDGASKNFFQKKILTPNSLKIITVSDMTWLDFCKYKIEFSVSCDGETRNYSIDPFLRGNT